MSTQPSEIVAYCLSLPLEEHRRFAAKAAMLRGDQMDLDDPVCWIEKNFSVDLWDKQKEIVVDVFNEIDVAVKSCHASGKTYVAAKIVLGFLAKFPEVIVITTAPTWNQVEKALWAEVHSSLAVSKYKFPKATRTELRLAPKRYAFGLSTTVTQGDEGAKFQGYHAPVMLLIFDEAPGIEPKIIEASNSLMASGDCHRLQIGNPTIGSGPFFDAFGNKRSSYKCHTISVFDTPNFKGVKYTAHDGRVWGDPKGKELMPVKDNPDAAYLDDDELKDNPVPYLVSKQWAKQQITDWGFEHPFVQARVFGEFPPQRDDALFWMAWLEAAQRREIGRPKVDKDILPLDAGLDVAGPGENETVLYIVRGPDIIFMGNYPEADARGRVTADLNRFRAASMDPDCRHLGLRTVSIDSIGMGWYMYCHLLEQGFPAIDINVGNPPRDPEKFVNLRAEIHWGLRERLAEGRLNGLVDDRTIGQAAAIRYRQTPQGKIQIEAKEDIVKRIGGPTCSPDRIEALMLAYAGAIDLSIWEGLAS